MYGSVISPSSVAGQVLCVFVCVEGEGGEDQLVGECPQEPPPPPSRGLSDH
jgi:hypothetical protein